MNIAIINFGKDWEVLCSTSILKLLDKKFKNSNIYWFTEEEYFPIIKYNNKIKSYNHSLDIFSSKINFDIVINFSFNDKSFEIIDGIQYDEIRGFFNKNGNIEFSDSNAEIYYDVINKKTYDHKDRNIFQIMYKLSGFKWRGEFFDLAYFPKKKTLKFLTGLAVKKDSLKKYIKSEVNLNLSKLEQISFKKNIDKRLDEINKYKRIITDDMFIAQAGICLKKQVEFLDVYNNNFKMEFFGLGNTYNINIS